LARASCDANQTRRLLSLAVIYDGGRRADAARTGGVGRQIVRDWVERFNALGPEGLIDRKAPGISSKLNDNHRAELARIVERGPISAVDGVVRWRLIDLAEWVRERFGIAVSEATMSRTLKALGFAKLSARPRHYAQDEGVPFTYDDAVIDLVAQRCTEVESGGRMIDAILTNTVLPTLSTHFLTRMMGGKPATRVHVGVENSEFTFAFD